MITYVWNSRQGDTPLLFNDTTRKTLDKASHALNPPVRCTRADGVRASSRSLIMFDPYSKYGNCSGAGC